MKIRSIRREIRLLRLYALASTLVASIALIGAAVAVREVSFDTITAHRIDIRDREGKLAMVLASHDDEAAPVIYGYTGKRAQGNNADNGIIFFNQNGDEQGGLIWSASADRSESSDTLSFDTAQTDQLVQFRDGDANGHHYAQIVGWDRATNESATVVPLMRALDVAKTSEERAAIERRLRSTNAPRRFLLGYNEDDVAQLVLDDKSSKPRIKLFVTPEGEAKLQFLDAAGNVTAEYPK